MRLLVDMNLPPNWVAFLSKAGFEAIHWSEVGSGRASDRELMEWAAQHDCVLLTADLDFGAILAATQRRGPSVVQLRSDVLSPKSIGHTVVAAIKQTLEDLTSGAIVSVDSERARLRVLPIGRR